MPLNPPREQFFIFYRTLLTAGQWHNEHLPPPPPPPQIFLATQCVNMLFHSLGLLETCEHGESCITQVLAVLMQCSLW